MRTRNTGDLRKATSNHWFFSYLPTTEAMPGEQPPPPNCGGVSETGRHYTGSSGFVARYIFYFLFLFVGFCSIYTQVAMVHSTYQKWLLVSREAFGFEHAVASARHERLARKFHLQAHMDALHGFQAHIKAEHGLHDSLVDRQNATAMREREKQDIQAARQEKFEAHLHHVLSEAEHQLYLDYQANATQHEQKALELEEEARRAVNQSLYYQQIFPSLWLEENRTAAIEESLLEEAEREGQLADNITQEEKNWEEVAWICHVSITRKLICGPIGGLTKLREADRLRKQHDEDYAKAMELEKQVRLERTKAMKAESQATLLVSKANLSKLQAELSHNASLQDEIKAAKEHEMELKDLQKEFEELQAADEHLHDFEYYQSLEVRLEVRSKKDREYAKGEWELGSSLLEKGKKEQSESNVEWDLAKAEEEKQATLVKKANELGRYLRYYALTAVAFAVIAFIFFILALVSTDTVSLGYYVKICAKAVSVIILRPLQGFDASWEGRSIMGDAINRNYARQLSCWFHHCLFFITVAGLEANRLSSIVAHESNYIRGGNLLQFAVMAGALETMMFQAIPHACVLSDVTLEYIRNVIIRLISSTMVFAIQMALLLMLCGQDSTWLFDWIRVLNVTWWAWALLSLVTVVAHYVYIEYPYVEALGASAMSDLTSATSGTVTVWQAESLLSSYSCGSPTSVAPVHDEEESGSKSAFPPAINNETESLLTVSQAPLPGGDIATSGPYQSVSLDSPANYRTNTAASYAPAALQRLYEVSIQDEFYLFLAHVELAMMVGVVLVICVSLPKIAHR